MWLILLIFAATLLYCLIQRNFSYWSKKGVPGPKPLFLVGNIGPNLIGKKSNGQIITDIYREYENYPFVGMYKGTTPVLIIRDPDFIKLVMVKDFKHFINNDVEVDKDIDPIIGRNPFVMRGNDWRAKRSQLTGCFTSGKIKGMFPFMEHNCKRMVKYLEEKCQNGTTLEARELCMKYTLENVAICAFGVDGRAFDEECSEFQKLAEDFISPNNPLTNIKIWLIVNFPVLNRWLKLKFTPKDIENKILDMVSTTLKYRKENNIVRNDFLDVCSRISSEKGLFTELDITAHSVSFFGDGYESSSRVMGFALFELAANPDVQEKLRQELNESYAKNGNTFTYEAVSELPYLDACFCENLRKNSLLYNLGKICEEDYTYTSTNPDFKKMTVHLKAGDQIAIPLMGLQNDPKYHEDPDKYMPERFLAKENIPKFTYLPFGEGPRVCLGQRFAQTQIKVGLAYLIKNFRCTLNEKTKLPLKIDPFYFLLHAVDGLWINLEKI